ncbi:lipase family protein [Antrihabitans sp. YC2-6]|uniref:lipase family protein n=1 Tax=Antrihabitans sp. YC2-6 TaxID=2799498 RepID=UPI0018F4207B|nr:lipase family protein [Antrihabitans sp. YC2-6]MBJ8348315.1 lipase [Antrihabitans sp. YC2-6]
MGQQVRRSAVAFVLGLVIACAGSLGLPAVAPAQPFLPTPDPDPFFSVPADIAAYAPGDALRVRPMPPLDAFPGSAVWQVLFRSTNSEGRPIAANTTMVIPANHVPDGPLLSYQHYVNSLGTRCKVANELYSTDPTAQVPEAPALNIALERGWAVALPDHLGLEMAYGAAKLGGLIVLDGIRAVQRVPEFRVANSKVGIGGASGGGMASAWAAALAPEYAPELDIVGAALGGAPVNLVKMALGLGTNPHPAFGLAMAAAFGLEREYPDRLDVSGQLNATGRELQRLTANGCNGELMFWGFNRSAGELTDRTDFIHDPVGWQLLSENSLELFPGVPTAPIFEWHSPTDALIPLDSINALMRRWCDGGTPVYSFATDPLDHLAAAAVGMPRAVEWLEQKFAGLPTPTTC